MDLVAHGSLSQKILAEETNDCKLQNLVKIFILLTRKMINICRLTVGSDELSHIMNPFCPTYAYPFLAIKELSKNQDQYMLLHV